MVSGFETFVEMVHSTQQFFSWKPFYTAESFRELCFFHILLVVPSTEVGTSLALFDVSKTMTALSRHVTFSNYLVEQNFWRNCVLLVTALYDAHLAEESLSRQYMLYMTEFKSDFIACNPVFKDPCTMWRLHVPRPINLVSCPFQLGLVFISFISSEKDYLHLADL